MSKCSICTNAELETGEPKTVQEMPCRVFVAMGLIKGSVAPYKYSVEILKDEGLCIIHDEESALLDGPKSEILEFEIAHICYSKKLCPCEWTFIHHTSFQSGKTHIELWKKIILEPSIRLVIMMFSIGNFKSEKADYLPHLLMRLKQYDKSQII